MNEIYQQALNGQLASNPSGAMRSIRLWNNLPLDIQLFYLTEYATRAAITVLPEGYAEHCWLADGDYILFTCVATGSFVGVAAVTSGVDSMFLGHNYMVPPNSMGLPPQPSADTLIPPDSPRVLVAAGHLTNGNRTLREQYWRRTSDSYSIAPGETQTVSTSTSSNMQQTSSSSDTVSASIGASASAGWGPMSVGLSASLSATSTHSQEVSLSTENTSYLSDTLVGPEGGEAQMFIKWQLMDLISVVNPAGVLQSTVVSGLAPIVVQGPYVASQLSNARLIAAPEPGAIGSPRTVVRSRAFHPQIALQA